jgi:hypothetical protein
MEPVNNLNLLKKVILMKQDVKWMKETPLIKSIVW